MQDEPATNGNRYGLESQLTVPTQRPLEGEQPAFDEYILKRRGSGLLSSSIGMCWSVSLPYFDSNVLEVFSLGWIRCLSPLYGVQEFFG